MKHSFKVTLALIIFFFTAQVVGLIIINQYIDHPKSTEAKEIVLKPLPYGLERPEIENKSTSFLYVMTAILMGTVLVLLLIRFNKPYIWRFWFFATVWLTLSIAFAAFIDSVLAAIIALIVAVLKLYRPNIIIQNTSEVFIYGGLAAFFVNIFNLFAVFILLILISVYDFIAVYKTKHMIKLAKFQSKSKVFPGLLIPYEKEKITAGLKASSGKTVSKKSRLAVLGGGDIGFTLLFAGVVMKDLMLHETVFVGFVKALTIPIIVTMALLLLLVKGRENKFYPAMPVLSLGCFLGYLIVALIS